MNKNFVYAFVIPIVLTISSCGDSNTSIPGNDKGNDKRLDVIKEQHIFADAKNTQNSNTTITALDEKKTMDNEPIAKASRFDFPSCEKLKSENLTEEQLIAHLDAHYSAELVNAGVVEKTDLSSNDIAQLTGYAACIASLTPGPDAPESALALFASKRHGKSAMAALKRQANGSTDAAKAARQFVNQMKSYLAGPSEG